VLSAAVSEPTTVQKVAAHSQPLAGAEPDGAGTDMVRA
jgi:hypothetical protein